MKRQLSTAAILQAMVVGLLALVIASQLPTLHFQDDSLWFVSTIREETRGRDLIDAAWFLLDPRHGEYAVFVLNLHTAIIQAIAGPRIEAFLAVSFLLHLLCARWLFLLARRLDLSRITSHLVAGLFLVFYPHFDAYLWPMAAQHQYIVLFTLVGLVGYLDTERRIAERRTFAPLFLFTTAVGLAASLCRVSAVILPLSIFAHILAGDQSGGGRARRFRRWLPLFACFLFYPIVELTVSRPDALRFITDGIGGHARLMFILMVLAGGILLTGALGLLTWLDRENRTTRLALRMAAFITMTVALLAGGFSVPSVSGALWDATFRPGPFSTTELNLYRWNYLPVSLRWDMAGWAGGGLILFLSLRAARSRPAWIIPLTWLASFAGIFFGYSASIFRGDVLASAAPSRYFYYLTPPFFLMLGYTLDLGHARLKALLAPPIMRRVVIGTAVYLVLAHLLALTNHLYRYRMANNFPSYEAIRAAAIIAEDVKKQGAQPHAIRVRNAPSSFFATASADFGSWDRFFMMRTELWRNMGYPDRFVVRVNDEPVESGEIVYTLDGAAVRDASGANRDPFASRVESVKTSLWRHDDVEALKAVKGAIRERPFLLRFLLGARMRDHLMEITNGSSLGPWLKQVKVTHFSRIPFTTRVDETADRVEKVQREETKSSTKLILIWAYLISDSSRGDLSILMANALLIESDLAPAWRDAMTTEWSGRIKGFREFLAHYGREIHVLPQSDLTVEHGRQSFTTQDTGCARCSPQH